MHKEELKVKPEILDNLDFELPVLKEEELSAVKLAELYKDTDVPEHRYNVVEMVDILEKVSFDAGLAVGKLDTISALSPVKKKALLTLKSWSSVAYEELRCVGLRYDTDTLAAILTVKKPNGYQGGLCKKGSYEYVAFWADWDNNGTFDKYLGTTAVNVHDISSIPQGGLHYAVYLPVNLLSQRRLCNHPRIVRIRAVLSWQVKPSTNDPDWNPYWGNKVDALIQLKPGKPLPEAAQVPILFSVGDMAVDDINASGYANGSAVISGFTAVDSPFGALVTVTGEISNPPNITSSLPGIKKLRYKVEYRKFGDALWINLTNKFQITVWEDFIYSKVNQKVDGDGYYEYQEDTDTSDYKVRYVIGDVLGRWYTQGLPDGLYELRVVVEDSNGNLQYSPVVRIRLDNTGPSPDTGTVKVKITKVNGSSLPPGPTCGTFQIGDEIEGEFTVQDSHFLRYNFEVLPAGLNPNSVVPLYGKYLDPAHPAPGTGVTNETWKLDTHDMRPCGYVVVIHARDRTVVNSGYIGWHGKDSVGFCLTKKKK
jgi:hypothetical protein